MILDGNMQTATTALTVATIALAWHWSMLGHRGLVVSTHGELIRNRNFAVSCGLGLCLAAGLSTLLHPFAGSAPLTVLAILVHAARDPSREAFWHHGRVRAVGISILVGLVGIGSFLLSPPLLPLLGAVSIFHHHIRQNRKLMRRLLTEIDQLSRRNVSLNASIHNQSIITPQSGDDISAEAS